MMKSIRILVALLAFSSPAAAQIVQLQPGEVLGNSTASRALAGPASMSAMLNRSLTGGSTQGALATRTATAWIGLAPGTAGLPLLSGGAAANLAYGILGLSGGGCNAALTASNGGLLYSTATACAILAGTATAGQIPRSGSSAAPSWSTATYPNTAAAGTILAAGALNVIAGTATPVLGVPGSLLGTIGLAGSGSGTATITPQAAAGSPTLTLPNASGTFAVSASTPIVLSATTGALTCPTCVTSSGGGAITGTAPVAVSAGGVVSITGLAGGVLAGSSPAFTTTPTLGASGTLGTIAFGNATSGTITLTPVTGALGSVTLTMPAATDTLAILAGAQAFTNKTYNGLTLTSTTGTLTLTNAKTFAVQNSLTLVGTDGTTWTGPSTNATLAALNIAAQTLTGGANVTSGNLGTVSSGTTTLNCGTVPLQYLTNNGAFTLAAPANDGSCIVNFTNGASAGTITFSGWTVGTNTGDAYATTNANKYSLFVRRINGTASYQWSALQ